MKNSFKDQNNMSAISWRSTWKRHVHHVKFRCIFSNLWKALENTVPINVWMNLCQKKSSVRVFNEVQGLLKYPRYKLFLKQLKLYETKSNSSTQNNYRTLREVRETRTEQYKIHFLLQDSFQHTSYFRRYCSSERLSLL